MLSTRKGLRTMDETVRGRVPSHSEPDFTIENAAIISFGSQIGTINASLDLIAKQGASNEYGPMLKAYFGI